MNKLKNGYIFLSILFWPVSLYLANTPQDFYAFFLPATFLGLAYFLHKRSVFFSNLFILLIGIFSIKLILFPLLYFLTSFIVKPSKSKVIFTFLAFCILLFNWNSFKGQTVFQKDYEAEQQVLRDTKLYDSIFLARAFHNKARIPLEKVTNNFFSLIDPNNYFFSFHPRENINNQNLQKFPFLSILFFLLGLYYLKKYTNFHFIVLSLTTLIASLSILTNFDRSDIILWFPLSLIIIHGIKTLKVNSFFGSTFFGICILFSFVEAIRILLKI